MKGPLYYLKEVGGSVLFLFEITAWIVVGITAASLIVVAPFMLVGFVTSLF